MVKDEETELKLKQTYRMGTKAYNIAEEILERKGFLSLEEKSNLAEKYKTKKNYVYTIITKLRKEGLIDDGEDDIEEIPKTKLMSLEHLAGLEREIEKGPEPTQGSFLIDPKIGLTNVKLKDLKELKEKIIVLSEIYEIIKHRICK